MNQIVFLTKEDKHHVLEIVGEFVDGYMDDYILSMKNPSLKNMIYDVMTYLQGNGKYLQHEL